MAFIILGLLTGVLSGLLGIGGGAIIVPILSILFGMSQHMAVGTSLGAMLLPVGLLGAWEYYKAGNIDFKASLLIAIGLFLGAWFGGMFAQHLSPIVMRRIFAIFLLLLAAQMLIRSFRA